MADDEDEERVTKRSKEIALPPEFATTFVRLQCPMCAYAASGRTGTGATYDALREHGRLVHSAPPGHREVP